MVLPEANSKKVLDTSEKGGGERWVFKVPINQELTNRRYSSSEGFCFFGRPLFSRTSNGATTLTQS